MYWCQQKFTILPAMQSSGVKICKKISVTFLHQDIIFQEENTASKNQNFYKVKENVSFKHKQTAGFIFPIIGLKSFKFKGNCNVQFAFPLQGRIKEVEWEAQRNPPLVQLPLLARACPVFGFLAWHQRPNQPCLRNQWVTSSAMWHQSDCSLAHVVTCILYLHSMNKYFSNVYQSCCPWTKCSPCHHNLLFSFLGEFDGISSRTHNCKPSLTTQILDCQIMSSTERFSEIRHGQIQDMSAYWPYRVLTWH